MIAAISWQLHDHERRLFVINTNELDVSNSFIKDLKSAIETADQYDHVQMDGNKYDDLQVDFIHETNVELPFFIDKFISVHIDFEG